MNGGLFATYTARTNGRLAHLSPDDYVYKEYGILCGRYSNTTRLTCYILGDSVLYDMKDNWNDQRAVTVIVRSFEGSTIVLDVYINFNIVIANLHNYRPLARHLSTSVKARQPIQQFNNNNIPELPLLDDFTGQLPENMRTALYRYQQADVLWMQKVEHMILQKTPFARQMRYQAVVVPHALREEYPHVPYTHSGNTILFVDTEYQDIHSMFAAKPEDVTQTTYLTRGAMLGNEVGTGKTLTILSLVQSTAIPDILDPVVNINGETRYASRATLLVCSSHLCKQWEQEVKKHFVNKWKIVVIVDKRSHSKYKYRDLIGADLVIVSDSFLTGGYYKEFLVPRGSISGSVQHTSTLFRKAALSNHSRTVQSRNVCFEMIFWNRIVLDEAHESLHVKRRSHSASNTTLWYSLNSNIMEHLHSRFRWAVSGTINLSTNDSIASMAHFLQIESTTVDIGFNHQDIHWEHKTNISEAYRDILLTGRYSHVKRMMFDCMFMRRTVDQVKAEIDLPNLHEQQIMIQLTDVERALYEDMVHRQVSEDELLQLCCHPLIAPRIRQLDQDRSRTQNIQHRGHGQQKKQDVPIMTLTELSKRLLGKHVEELAELMSAQVSIEEKMDVLSGEIDELETMIGSGTLSTVVQKTLEETLQLKRSKQVKLDTSANKVEIKIARVERLVNYLRQVTKRIREDPKCMICLGEDETIHGVTKCGHSFCYDCIMQCIAHTTKCPACRMPLTQSDVTKVTSAETQEGAAPMEDEETKDDYVVNDHSELRERFGAKTAALVEFLQDRVHTSSSFIIFSEWEKQLQYVGSVLSAQGITNKWARGNIAVRNKAVRDFNSGACKVLMLSFDYMASGLDLSKADHVLFLGPLTKGQNVATVEQQAIGRALRAGQTKQVNLIRFITEGTIEQQYNDARTS